MEGQVGDARSGDSTKIIRPGGALLDKDRFDAGKVLKGRWRDEVYRRVKGHEVKVEDSDWQSNLIVVGMPKLLAGLMANEPSFSGGILYHAQGRGLPSWDVQLPVPQFGSTQLTDEYFRKPPDSITYLDGDGNPTIAVTNSILIRTTLDYPEANGVSGEIIREQGLFGGTATATANSGLLANLIFHRARAKDATVRVIRSINLVF